MQKRKLRITRDLILFSVGVAGIVWETVVVSQDRPYLLAVFAACVGLPVFLASALRDSGATSDLQKKSD